YYFPGGKSVDDYNPHRILTVKLPPGTTHYTLPAERMLTAGQTYYWAVRVITKEGQRPTGFGTFQTLPPAPLFSASPFSSVTVLVHGFQFEEFEASIKNSGAISNLRKFLSLGNWVSNLRQLLLDKIFASNLLSQILAAAPD